MTIYEYYQKMSDICSGMARALHNEANLASFYAHASEGYKIKQQGLKVSEAKQNYLVYLAGKK